MNIFKKYIRCSCRIQRAMNVGICWAVKDPSDASFKSGKRRLHISAAFEGPFEMGQHLTRRCDVCGLQMRPSKDAAPELGHGLCVPSECIAAGMYYVLCIYVAESVGTSLFAMLGSNK